MKKEHLIRTDVQFRHMPKSAAIEHLVEDEVVDLERFAHSGTHCEVVVDETQHCSLGGVFSVRIQLVIPGSRCYVVHRNSTNGSVEFIYGAICDAFEELRQLLHKRCSIHMRRQRREMAA